MKTLIRITDAVWLDPKAIEALVFAGNGTIVFLSSGETFTIYGKSPDDVLDIIQSSLDEEGEA